MTTATNDTVQWGAVCSVLLGMVAFAFSVSSLSISIPSIMAGLNVDVDRIQWVVTSFEMVQTVVMPTVGWLGGIMGNRDLFLTGIGISLLGGCLGGMAWNLESLLVFQVLQGMGAGLMQPTLTAILYGLFPPSRRGLAVALSMTAFGFGPTLGSILAGYLIEHVSWRATFYIQTPFILASFVLTLLTMRNVIERRVQRIDFPGLITMSTFLICLLVALTQGHKEEWTSLYIVGLFAISAIAFCLFVVIELTVDDPIVDLRLYRHLSFTMGCLLGFLNTLVFRGSGFLMSVFVQYTLQYSPIQAGYMNAPSGLAFGSMSYLSGRLSDRFGPRLPIAIGMVLFIFHLFLVRQHEPLEHHLCHSPGHDAAPVCLRLDEFAHQFCRHSRPPRALGAHGVRPVQPCARHCLLLWSRHGRHVAGQADAGACPAIRRGCWLCGDWPG